jgi:uncharacterized protein YgiM (DUF1202 family)
MLPKSDSLQGLFMRYRALGIVVAISCLWLLGTVWGAAQDGTSVSSATCAPALQAVWTAASDACISGPEGFICNGGSAPQVEPVGAVSNALANIGALVQVDVVQSIRTQAASPDGTNAGLAWLRLSPPIQATGLLIGDVNVRNNAQPGFPAWQAMVVQTGAEVPTCGAMPHNVFIVQSPFNQTVNIAVNGVSLGLNGTLLIQTRDGQTVFAGLSGVSSVYAMGQDQALRTGQQIIVPYNPGDYSIPIGLANPPEPLDTLLGQNLPVALLDRPIIVPQPGYVITQGAVNLRVSPSTDAGVIFQVPAGQVLSVLGRSPDAQWFHVRLDSGETGWMLAELLLQNVGDIQAVYDATPLPPQRYGLMGQIAKVLAPAGVNLRSAPDVMFSVVAAVPDGATVTLLARSPYSPWVKVDYNGVTGWLALITLETEAVIDALPVDYDVPPPPSPTRVPGSFGNAFPDPNAGG